MHNKKGISYEAVMKIPDMIFLIVAFMVVLLLIGLHIKTNVESFLIETDIVTIRMLYDQIAYFDHDTGRSYPGIIDLKKLDTAYLERNYLQPPDYMPVKITFAGREAYLYEGNYKDNYAARFVRGTGRVNLAKNQLYALAYDNGGLKTGTAEVIASQKA